MTPTLIDHRLHTWLKRMLLWFVCGLTLLAFQNATFAAARRIVNLSTRANVGTGPNVVIAGIIVQGYGTATLVLRGIGPSLAPYFPSGTVLTDPSLQLFDSQGTLIWANDNWQDTQAAEISATRLAPSNYYESAIKISVAAGSYTAVLAGAGGGTGMALVEVYDITPQPNSIRLANISTRAHSENSYAKETLGMILQGSGNRNILIRGLGPSIPMAGTLPNPFIGLYGSNGALLNWNDDWKRRSDGTSQEAQIVATGAAPTNDLESATVASLGPDSFTTTMQDNSGTTGIAVVEMYDLEPAPTPPPPPPTPTATPPPQRLLWQDSRTYAVLVGWDHYHTTHNPAQLWTSGQLSLLTSGTITVHFRGYANGTCEYGCPGGYFPPPYNAWLYAQVLNQFGTVVAESAGGTVGQNTQNITITRNFSWGTGPFYVRMMAQSDSTFPNPDNVFLTYYDVYGP